MKLFGSSRSLSSIRSSQHPLVVVVLIMICYWTLPVRAFVISRQKMVSSTPRFYGGKLRSFSTIQSQHLFVTTTVGRGRAADFRYLNHRQPLQTARLTPTVLRFSTTTPSSTSPSVSVKTMRYVQDAVLEALQELFDPAEVARGAALAKLEKPKKKKKKKNQDDDQDNEEMSDAEKQAIADAAAEAAKPFSIADTMVTLATRADFGDYQVNAAMGLAKSLGMNPRECASKIVEKIRPKIEDCMEEPEIAGPGFVNLRFKPEYLTSVVEYMTSDPAGRLGLPKVANPQRIIVDYSSPNIAKEMHVGHLRSTIIGDTLSNLLSFSGHDVVRLNHVGDWGTQFGMLVEHLRDEYPAALSLETSQDVDLGDLVELYKAAKKRFDVDEDFKARAREGVVNLQAGNEEEIAAWQALCAASRVEYQKIYDMLGIKGLEERGESFYNPYLDGVVKDLEKKGLAVESEGATAVFVEGVSGMSRCGIDTMGIVLTLFLFHSIW
jgi:tRNA synthetases class I (R)/Arginyl tRNA synthetase N terminal domain